MVHIYDYIPNWLYAISSEYMMDISYNVLHCCMGRAQNVAHL